MSKLYENAQDQESAQQAQAELPVIALIVLLATGCADSSSSSDAPVDAQHPGTITFVDRIRGTEEVKSVDEVPDALAWVTVDGVPKPVLTRALTWHFDHYRTIVSGLDGEWLGTDYSSRIPLKRLVTAPDLHPSQLRFYTDDEILIAYLEAAFERAGSEPCVEATEGEPGEAPSCVQIRDARVDEERSVLLQGVPESSLDATLRQDVASCTLQRFRWLDELRCTRADGHTLRRAVAIHEEPPSQNEEVAETLLIVDEPLGLQWERRSGSLLDSHKWVRVGRHMVPVARIVQRVEDERVLHDQYTEDGLLVLSWPTFTRLPPPPDAEPIQGHQN